MSDKSTRTPDTSALVPFTSETAREAARKSNESRERNKRERTEENQKLRDELAAMVREARKQSKQIADLRAELVGARAERRVARQDAEAMRRRLEATEQASARKVAQAVAQSKKQGKPVDAVAPSVAERMAEAELGAIRTLRSILATLATEARGGSLIRSGADAAALLDSVGRAVDHLAVLTERVATSSVSGRRRTQPAIEATGTDALELVAELRKRMSASPQPAPIPSELAD
jgi:myosin heavy subunit